MPKRLIIGLLLSLVSVGTQVHAAPLAPHAQEAAVIQACLDWLKPLDIEAPLSTERVEGGLCLNGHIQANDDKPVLAQLDAFDKAAPLVVVVRSSGGEVNAAMAIGESLLDRPTTVIAEQLCASSCANFLITAGHRRIVRPDALLLYHGATTLDQLDQLLPQLQASAVQDDTLNVADTFLNTYNYTVESISRQDAFLTKAGISPTLFRWMDLINHMTPSEADSHCPPDSAVIQYPASVLARFGLTFDEYDPPNIQNDIDVLEHKLGKKAPICYWRD
ncbi:ATP-dependent Clp protease proteolytic subunit [Asticcacaulis sp.]|uniref:ATP-dependent Clp protease proteolytic subunit n=1 Tax=Asticcacaulis sp. TaxID=1872648 RepID=UPI003F7CA601